MKLPDLLATKWGRMAAFFFLYMTEGIPLGFTATAVATQMRRQGLGVAEIGAFVGSLYLPWAFKWAYGPFVDVLSSERWGRRRMWIVIAQIMMILTLLAALPVNFSTEVKLFTLLIIVHNVFAATQDVAIDALAVNVLKQEERGLANGLMFGGAYLGQALGGSGVLFLTSVVDFRTTFLFVAGAIALVTVLVALPLRERKGEPRPRAEGSPLLAAGGEMVAFARDALRAFFGSRAAFVGLIFAVLPAGAYALGLALQSNLAVELGMNNNAIAALNLWSTVISALCCVAGGWLSDRLGRRRMLALYIAATAIPTLILAFEMQKAGWIMPVSPNLPNRPLPPQGLVATFWAMVLLYSVFNGLMYGTRTALFMDVTTPRVAATQFTAYMALLNLVISYSANWQGWALARWGYPRTLLIDSVIGLFGIALLPLMSIRPRQVEEPAGAAIPDAITP
jgi:MFS transporter, PAT family, beta-lactamase induction signal transducer AmpG